MWKSPPSSSLTHSPASSTSAPTTPATRQYPPARRPSRRDRDPSPLPHSAGSLVGRYDDNDDDRGRYGYGLGYGHGPDTAYNTYQAAQRRADRHGLDDLDDDPPAPTQDRRQYYSHARPPSPPPTSSAASIPRSPRPIYDDRVTPGSALDGGTSAGLGWQPRPRRPSARPPAQTDHAADNESDHNSYDRYRYQQTQQRNGSFSTVAMSPRSPPSAPAASLSPTQIRPGQVYPRDADADASPRYPPSATLGRQPSFSSRPPHEELAHAPLKPEPPNTLKGSKVKPTTKKRGCLDWTRWLVAGSLARIIMAVCLMVLALHSFMCGGGAMFLLVMIPIAGWSADGSLSIFGFRVSPPPAPPAGSAALDAPYALTVLGVFLLVGVLVDLVATFAAFKLANRKLPGLAALGLAEVTQIVRVVFLVLMINQAKTVEGWDQSSEMLARVFVVVEIIQLVTAAALFFTSRWRWNEKQKFQGTGAAALETGPGSTKTPSVSTTTLDSAAARRPSDIEMVNTPSTADRPTGLAKAKMRFHW